LADAFISQTTSEPLQVVRYLFDLVRFFRIRQGPEIRHPVRTAVATEPPTSATIRTFSVVNVELRTMLVRHVVTTNTQAPNVFRLGTSSTDDDELARRWVHRGPEAFVVLCPLIK
jgi:hypothetical protein